VVGQKTCPHGRVFTIRPHTLGKLYLFTQVNPSSDTIFKRRHLCALRTQTFACVALRSDRVLSLFIVIRCHQ
jgi:hypothetical protein